MTAAPTAPSPSGIAAVDRAWGGLRSGASVLLVGRAAAGRTTLALESVRAAVAAGQTALLLSPRAPADLNAAAQGAGFDLAALHASGRLRVLRIPSAKDLATKGNAGLDSAYRDLAGLAAQSGAHRVVIEDLTPLVQFTTFEAFGAAFDGLRESLGETVLVVGLGEPANEPSRQLIGTVQERVGGTVRVAGDTVTFEAAETPAETEAPEPPAPEAPSFTAEEWPAPAPAEAAPSEPPSEEKQPEPTQPPLAEAPSEPSPEEAPVATAPPPDPAPTAQPAVAPAPELDSGLALDPPPVAESAPASEDAPPSDPEPSLEEPDAFEPPSDFEPAPPTFGAESLSSDGASVSVSEPEPVGHDLDFAPEIPTAPASAAGPDPAEPTPSGLMNAGVEPALPPDPELMAPSSDPFGRDPGKAFFENGYLVDSKGATTTPITAAQQEPAEYAPPPQPMPPPGVPPVAAPSMPSFAPLGAPAGNTSNDPGPAQAALQAAFSARAQGTPFLVIAARMEPSQPESAQFSAVVDGLRAATPPGGTFYADVSRLRSLLLLPGATAEAASGVFAGLQQHLQSALGPQAEGTLRAVAAITVPDGQPFGTAQELWEYAVAS